MKEYVTYSLNNSDFFTKSEFIEKYKISENKFNYLRCAGKLYKAVNGVKYNKVHIANGDKCNISFDDCNEKTTVYKMDRYINRNGERGDYLIVFKDINDKMTSMLLTINEFQTMFNFIVVFKRYANIEMEKKQIQVRFGKGVEFI